MFDRLYRTSYLVGCCCLLWAAAAMQISDARATDGDVESNRDRFLLPPLASQDQVFRADSRFQKMLPSNGESNNGWGISLQASKQKVEKSDIKAEISALNTTYIYQSSWPEAQVTLGAVTAVAFDREGNVVIFHRVDRLWTQRTFDNANVYTERSKGAIRENTVLALDHDKGSIVYAWGKNMFYMPHGLTIDHEANVWVTDVALHQVFKFAHRGGDNQKPLLTLGTPFTPGSGDKFCKPTSVAVLKNGDFFVADGYCNARIIKYSKMGEKILTWGQNSFAGVSFEKAPKNFFAIPHALTLVPERELVCAADRENGRIQCFFWSNGTFHSQYYSPIIGDRLFSMDYTPAEGGEFVIVNGPVAEMGISSARTGQPNEVHGFIMKIKNKEVISKFGPNNQQFHNPHDVAVSADAKEIYVAELDPTRIHKFVHRASFGDGSGQTSAGALGQASMIVTENQDWQRPGSEEEGSAAKGHTHPGGTAILVASLMLLFAVVTFLMAFFVARRRKRGNSSSYGQPSELVYRKLVASSRNVCVENA